MGATSGGEVNTRARHQRTTGEHGASVGELWQTTHGSGMWREIRKKRWVGRATYRELPRNP